MSKEDRLLEFTSEAAETHLTVLQLQDLCAHSNTGKCCATEPDCSTIRSAMLEVCDDESLADSVVRPLMVKSLHVLEHAASDAAKHATQNAMVRALRRLPSLSITFAIELLVAFVINQFVPTFNQYPLLISMQPVISAISGNVGLQSSSINVRGISAGFANNRCKAILREVYAGIWLAFTCGMAVGFVAGVWYYAQNTSNTHGAIMFGITIAIGQALAAMSACATGAAAPIIFKALNFDPANLAGPMETAFQDVVGSSVLLFFSAWFLSATGAGSACPSENYEDCQVQCLTNETFLEVHKYNTTRICIGICDSDCP